MKGITWLLLCLPFGSICQISPEINKTPAEGIHFESGLSWKEIKAKASAENKFIFMDCYATWCGPCKFMSREIFTKKSVGDFMNNRFINVAVQLDQTAKDNEAIKNWYTDAAEIANTYSIHEFPTYLFFTPDGQPVHRITGATGSEPDRFIDKAKETFDPQKQYYYLVGNYKSHLQDLLFLRKALKMCVHAGDIENAELISDAFVSCLKDNFNPDDLQLIKNAIQTSQDKGFTLFMNNAQKLDSILPHGVEHRLSSVIAHEDISPLFLSDSVIYWEETIRRLKNKYPDLNEKTTAMLYDIYEGKICDKEIRDPLYGPKATATADWDLITRRIEKKYPDYNPDRLIAKEKPRYYLYKKMWPELDQSTLSYLNQYGHLLDKGDLNSIAWDYVFLHSTNHELLTTALNYSKNSLPDTSVTIISYNPSLAETYANFMDTYANLLYKLGEKEKAIRWEQKVLRMANRNPDESNHTILSYEITLKKMENDENTWNGRNSQYQEYP